MRKLKRRIDFCWSNDAYYLGDCCGETRSNKIYHMATVEIQGHMRGLLFRCDRI